MKVKVGDEIVCTKDSEWRLYPIANHPKVNEICRVTHVEGNYVSLEGYDINDGFHVRNFKKRRSFVGKLADRMLESLVSERHDNPKVFTLSAEF